MPIVTLKFQEKPLGEFSVAPDKTLTIGRRTENDVTIDNLAVSGLHGKIDVLGGEFIFTDLQSKNGSFINGELVSTHKLKHGDVITIGKHTLEFAYGEGEERPQKTDDDLFQTIVMDSSQHREMLKKAKPKKPVTQKAPPRAALSLIGGGQGEVPITKKLFKIGKGEQSDYRIEGFLVGQTSFTISLRPDGYYLSYAGGMAKPKVNGIPEKGTIKLHEFDRIELGKTKMQLVFKTPKKKK